MGIFTSGRMPRVVFFLTIENSIDADSSFGLNIFNEDFSGPYSVAYFIPEQLRGSCRSDNFFLSLSDEFSSVFLLKLNIRFNLHNFSLQRNINTPLVKSQCVFIEERYSAASPIEDKAQKIVNCWLEVALKSIALRAGHGGIFYNYYVILKLERKEFFKRGGLSVAGGCLSPYAVFVLSRVNPPFTLSPSASLKINCVEVFMTPLFPFTMSTCMVQR